MDTILKVRLMHFRDGLSMRFISRKMGLSRHTVKKYLDDASPPQYRRQIVPAEHKLHDFKDRLQDLFEHDLMLPKRGRRTAIKLYEQLVLEGYKGSYYPVRRHIQSIKHTALGASAAYIPMQFQSGDAMQFDWCEEHVVIGGVECKMKVAHFRLSHSRKPFVRAYINEQQEMLMDAFGHALKAKPFQSPAAMPVTFLFMLKVILGVVSILGEIIDRFDDDVMGVSAATMELFTHGLGIGVKGEILLFAKRN